MKPSELDDYANTNQDYVHDGRHKLRSSWLHCKLKLHMDAEMISSMSLAKYTNQRRALHGRLKKWLIQVKQQ
jgi:hypothetical protein